MFTGIIETLGEIQNIISLNGNYVFDISSSINSELHVDQSLSHDGVCLTIVEINKEKSTYKVEAVQETLLKTNLSSWQVGKTVNLERAMKLGDRLDGHLVQGHVDQIGICLDVQEKQGSWLFTFEYNPDKKNITIEKGSICVNGVSLTVINSLLGKFSVTIIPYTFNNTNFKYIKKGDNVNLEFDVIGKYLARLSLGYFNTTNS